MSAEAKEKKEYEQNTLAWWLKHKVTSIKLKIQARKAIVGRYGQGTFETHREPSLSKVFQIVANIGTEEGSAYWQEVTKQAGLAERSTGILDIKYKRFESLNQAAA